MGNNETGQAADPIALAVEALHELGFQNNSSQEMTAGMDAVFELMHMATDKVRLEAKLNRVEQHKYGRTAPIDEFKIIRVVGSVLGKDYKNVTISGDGVPNGYWSQFEKALALAGIDMTRQSLKQWLQASPLRWQRVLSWAAVSESLNNKK